MNKHFKKPKATFAVKRNTGLHIDPIFLSVTEPALKCFRNISVLNTHNFLDFLGQYSTASTGLWLKLRRGVFTCVGWQVTLHCVIPYDNLT